MAAKTNVNIYSLLKLNRIIKSPALKGLGIWLLHVLHKRYLVVFFDPVLSCNLRCKMCYYSNDEIRKKKKGIFTPEDVTRIAEVIFPEALKLQIGCGAEPSLYKHNAEIVRLGKQCGVPYISFTTNANLLTKDTFTQLLNEGLNEFTISLHGVFKETYENLMQGASYEKFMSVMDELSTAKNSYPHYKLRINYTVNEQNMSELASFFDVFGHLKIDIFQVRPVQNLGGEIQSIADKSTFNALFNKTTLFLKNECAKRGITYIAPLSLNEQPKKNKHSSIVDAMYCYISPNTFWDDMDWHNETFLQHCRRTHYAWRLFKSVFSAKQFRDDKLNYDIQ